MKTKRAISINNSLVHGICNCNCIICGVNKKTYIGPREYQSENITKKIVERVLEANDKNIYVRYIANSGDGEPTLHPEFDNVMNIFGDMKKQWNEEKSPPPEIAVVTNGLLLLEKRIFPSLVRNGISLKISIPTLVPEHYGEIMMMDPDKGKMLLQKLIPSVEEAMQLYGKGELSDLEFHISPPYQKYVATDFSETVAFLAKLARKNNMNKLKLLLFPAASNRTGVVCTSFKKINKYESYFRRYNRKKIDSIKIMLNLSTKRFYPHLKDIFELLFTFNYPCIWYGNIFLSPFGDSCCSNDQNISEPLGNIVDDSIERIMEIKENKWPTRLCLNCNQAPEKLRGGLLFLFYRLVTKLRLKNKSLSEQIQMAAK